MSTQMQDLRNELEALRSALAQEHVVSTAACRLADRYKKERDGARAEKAAVIAKAASAGESVSDAVATALAGDRGKNLLARDREAFVKDARPNVEHDLTESIAKRKQELSK
jgi:hypothetical protein